MKKIYISIICVFSLVEANCQTKFDYDINGNIISVKYTGSNPCGNFVGQNSRDEKVKLYPNPTSNILYAQTGSLDILIKEAFIYDGAGRLILSKIFDGNNFINLDVSKLPVAAYVINFITSNGQVSLKFVKG